jgi:hypothetical protein
VHGGRASCVAHECVAHVAVAVARGELVWVVRRVCVAYGVCLYSARDGGCLPHVAHSVRGVSVACASLGACVVCVVLGACVVGEVAQVLRVVWLLCPVGR